MLEIPETTAKQAAPDEKRLLESKTEDYQPYHPDLPSIAQARENYSSVRSDHVPILAAVPLKGSRETINIVSWNVLEADAASGFSVGTNKSYGESPLQEAARHGRIAESLKLFAEKNNPAFITLQEISAAADDNALLPRIQAALGERYAVVTINGKEVVDEMGNITFYDKTRFTPIIPTKEAKLTKRDFTHSALEGNITTYQQIHGGRRVRLLNAHTGFQMLPGTHEREINSFLVADAEATSVVVGDFNCNFAPLHTKPQNITTSATPACFRGGVFQGAYAIDGCFYSSSSGNRQAEIRHLNPLTGEAYSPTAIPLDRLPKLQREEVETCRMVMSVDSSYVRKKMTEGCAYTIFQYQSRLESQFEKMGQPIHVRPVRNLNNQGKMGLYLTEDLCRCIHFFDPEKFQFSQQENMQEPFSFIFFDRKDANLLIKLTDKIASNKKLMELEKSIRFLAQNDSADKDLIDKFTRVFRALVNENISLNAVSYEAAINFLIEQAKEIDSSENQTILAKLKGSLVDLDAALVGEPPFSPIIKACLCGVIFAVAGSLVGGALHLQVMNLNPKNFSDILDAMNGVLAMAGAGVGGVGGVWAGFFKGKCDQKAYENKGEKAVNAVVREEKEEPRRSSIELSSFPGSVE